MKTFGIGSPHPAAGGPGRIWPLGLVMQAMTADSKEEKNACLDLILASIDATGKTTKGMCESFSKNDLTDITRPWFGWPNSLLAEYLVHNGECSVSDADSSSNVLSFSRSEEL